MLSSPEWSSDRPVVEFREVNRLYGSGETAVHALQSATLTVPAGEVLFVTGPSGCGKTTLLSLAGCVLRPSSGQLHVLGLDVVDLDEAALGRLRLDSIGFVFQAHNLIGSLTARQNVRLPLLLAGWDWDEADRASASMLDSVGLCDKLDRLPGELSGGQRQRVAIARALVGRPRLLLADEPTAALDARSGNDVMILMTNLARERGTTLIVVTHDPRIMSFADRIVTLNDGLIVNDTITHGEGSHVTEHS